MEKGSRRRKWLNLGRMTWQNVAWEGMKTQPPRNWNPLGEAGWDDSFCLALLVSLEANRPFARCWNWTGAGRTDST